MLFAVMAYSIGLGLVTLMLALIFGISRNTPDLPSIDRLYSMRWDPATEHLWKNGNQYQYWRLVTFEDFEAEQTSFEYLTAVKEGAFNVLLDGEPERISGMSVTPDFFRAMGIRPLTGRFFSNEDPRSEIDRAIVVGYAFWKNKLKSDPDVIGRGLNVNGDVYTIMGVAPEGFDFIAEHQLWIVNQRQPDETRGVGHGYLVTGALKDGVSLAEAKAELDNLAKQFEERYPDTNTGFVSVLIEPLGHIYLPAQIRSMFDVMLVCSFLVLMIACANVANLLSSRMLGRTKELAIRSSLGATRSRLIGQILVEGVFIALLGGLGGWLVGEVASRAVWNFIVTSENVTLPSWMTMEIDLKVLLLLFSATLVASLLAGILPALRASKSNVNDVLKDTAKSSSGLAIGRISKLLVLLQMSFSLGLLIAAAAMVKTAQSSQQYEPPYDTDRMLIARLDLAGARYTNETRGAFFEELQEKLESLPGVRAAGFSSSYDLMYNWDSVMEVEGAEYARREDYPRMRNEIVSNDYFEKLGIPILQGRGFSDFDVPDSESVIVVNTHLAETYWPGQSPIGKRIRDTWSEENTWMTVVGVVPDTEMLGPGVHDEKSRAGFYQPLSQRTWLQSPTLYLYSDRDPLQFATPLRKAVMELDPELSPYSIKTVASAVRDNQFGVYFVRNIFGMFGFGSLFLASVGIYGVMSFSVNQRVMEYGIRRSLGALSREIVALIFRRGATQTLSGIALGAVFGYLLIVVLSKGMDEIESDALTYLLPTAFLASVAALALWLPSIRLTRLNLSSTLREG